MEKTTKRHEFSEHIPLYDEKNRLFHLFVVHCHYTISFFFDFLNFLNHLYLGFLRGRHESYNHNPLCRVLLVEHLCEL